MLLLIISDPDAVVASNVQERMDDIWEAIDKPLIKVSGSKKYLYIHFIL